MSLLDVTIVNVAIPSIRAGLHTGSGTVQWVVSGYALTFGLVLVTGGRLGDAYGRRRLMLVGLTGFIASSAAVGLAPTAALVITARLLQGAAAGLLTPQNSGLIQQLFSGAERGRAFGAFGFTVSVSSAVGPLLGGAIIALFGEEHGWRYIFLVNVPIGLVAMVFIARMVPGPPDDADRGGTRLDLVGAGLLGAAVLALLVPLVSVISGDTWLLVLLVACPVFAWAFLRWELREVRRGHAPLLDVGLLRQVPGYASGIAVGTLYFTGFTGVFLVMSVFLQEGLGLSALHSGLLTTPFAAGAAVTAPIAGRVVSRAGRWVTVGALVTMLAGVLLLALLVDGHEHSLLWPFVALPLLLAGLGGGGVVSPNLTLSLADVPTRMGGAAGGALQTGQRIGSALGAALLMTAYQVTLQHTGDPGRGVQVALVTSMLLLAGALALAVRDLRTVR